MMRDDIIELTSNGDDVMMIVGHNPVVLRLREGIVVVDMWSINADLKDKCKVRLLVQIVSNPYILHFCYTVDRR